MNTEKRTGRINANTKLAWQQNWEEIDIDTILTIFDYPRVKEMLKAYKSFLKKGDRIVEAGCGLGPWVIKLTRQGYDITGIDYDPVSISKIKKYDRSLKAYTADVRKVPFRDKYFDAYLSFGVFEHFIEGPHAALREANRILTDNGILLATVPYRNIFVKIKSPLEAFKQNAFLRTIFNKPKKAYYYQRFFQVDEICKIILQHGFELETVKPIDHIFSLVNFSNIFRDKNTYDGENKLAVITASMLKNILPWASADSTFIAARKKKNMEAL